VTRAIFRDEETSAGKKIISISGTEKTDKKYYFKHTVLEFDRRGRFPKLVPINDVVDNP
jgi:hypothetical protein